MDSGSSDVMLWEKYLSGDQTALGHIAERYFRILRHYGQKFMVGETIVEDCIQDLFLQLWQNRAHVNHTLSVKHYLIKGLRNHILMHIRSSRQVIQAEPDWDISGPEAIDGESILIRQESLQERIAQLQQLMGQLSPREREAIYLHYYEELSVPQIAEVMDVNRQSVSNFLSRAITKLRDRWTIQSLTAILYLLIKF